MEIIYNYRPLILFETFLLFVLGSLTISLPIVMTFNLSMYLGIIFLILGSYLILRAIVWRNYPGAWVPTIINLISYFVIGILLLTFHWDGTVLLTLLLCIWFAFDGITKVVIGSVVEDSLWFIYSGIIPIAFAISVWFIWPELVSWVFGIFVGITFLVNGLSNSGYLAVSLFRKNNF